MPCAEDSSLYSTRYHKQKIHADITVWVLTARAMLSAYGMLAARCRLLLAARAKSSARAREVLYSGATRRSVLFFPPVVGAVQSRCSV